MTALSPWHKYPGGTGGLAPLLSRDARDTA